MQEVENLCIERSVQEEEKYENFVIVGSLGEYLKIYKKEKTSQKVVLMRQFKFDHKIEKIKIV